MPALPEPRTRKLTVVAQDPSIKQGRDILTAKVNVPAERLKAGPWGHRVQVVDYDASTNTFYRPLAEAEYGDLARDPFAGATDGTILENPHFHCQNLYALVMRALARFEYALGRRLSWSFGRHQLRVVPHAFSDANAFYSEQDASLLFGYFPSRNTRRKMVYTCLSHDVVVHETTHALVDGLRDLYTEPSSRDQAAFHEGFADIVALLSVFSLKGVAEWIISRSHPGGRAGLISVKSIDGPALKKSGLFELAKEMGSEISLVRGQPLRHSVDLSPDPALYTKFQEPHRHGEVLVAAMLNAFVEVWANRLKDLSGDGANKLPWERVVEEGAEIADKLLTIAIRAIDYSPPVDINFPDFLSALITADKELYPDDGRYHFRRILLESFASYGVKPPKGTMVEGTWKPEAKQYRYDRTHFESMKSDPDEVFRFIWENREDLGLCAHADARVISVRPSIRIGPDGFMLRETVAECMQTLEVAASELRKYGIPKPKSMPGDVRLVLNGGTALIFDEYGHLKYNIHNTLMRKTRQAEKIRYLWETGMIKEDRSEYKNFARIHRERAVSTVSKVEEEW